MKKFLAAVLTSTAVLTPYSFAQDRYSIYDLHNLLRTNPDVDVSVNSWLYRVQFDEESDPRNSILFINGVENRTLYSAVGTSVNSQKVREIINASKYADVIIACTGPYFGDSNSDYEYFSHRNTKLLLGTDIDQEYKERFFNIVNDIAEALSKTK